MARVTDIPDVPAAPPEVAVTDAVEESDEAAGPASSSPAPALTRAARRLARERAPGADPAAPLTASWIPVAVSLALAPLLGVTAYAQAGLLAAAVALTGLLLAWGWFEIFQLPGRRIPEAILLVVALAGPAVVATTPDEPYLRRIPVVVVGGLMALLIAQLIRRPPREALTGGLAAGAAALAILTCSVAYLPLPQAVDGADLVACAAAAIAAGALGDLLLGRGAVHAWVLPISMLFGGAAAVVVSSLAGGPLLGQALLLGFLVSGIAHAVRRVLSAIPEVGARGQVAIGAAGLLTPGIVTFLVGRLLLGL